APSLEERHHEAGSMSSFIAAGTAYATHGINMIPFFIFYSMFGFQRGGDLIWAGAGVRMRGLVLGGTRHGPALPVPNAQSYAPVSADQLAVVVEDGIKRMYQDPEDIFHYLTLMNDN